MNGYKREGEAIHFYSGEGPLPEGYMAYEFTVSGPKMGIVNCRLPKAVQTQQIRQKAISEMLRVPHCPLSEQAAAELYDAGYRKFEIVEDDV